MKKIIVALFFMPTLLMAQITAVPDTNFELALINLGYDVLPLDGSVPTANINTVVNLDVSNEYIHDLKGIEDFVSLVHLDCSGNELIHLFLYNNTLLQTLNFSGCDINSIDLTNNTALTYIEGRLQGTGNSTNFGLDTINVSNLLSLTYLNVRGNEISHIDVTNNIALQKLDVSQNDINNLDVTQNSLLTHLYCSNNNLTSLNVTNNYSLEQLWCYYNSITTTINTSNNTVLKHFYCGGNQIYTLDLTNNTLLYYLHCEYNNLSDLDLTYCSLLLTLDCSYNTIDSLNLDSNIYLGRLYTENNLLTELDLANNYNLKDVNCSNNNIEHLYIPSTLPWLRHIRCSNNLIDSLTLRNCPELRTVYCSNNEINYLKIDSNSVLKKLHFNNNIIDSINLNGCDTSLTELRCDSNLLVSLDVGNHYKLDSLSCSNNSLEQLNIYSFCDTNYLFLNTLNNQNLSCIKVQDVNWATNTLTPFVDTWSNFDLDCSVSFVDDQKVNLTKDFIKVLDVLGRESNPTPNMPLFYYYSDGTVEKRIIVE